MVYNLASLKKYYFKATIERIQAAAIWRKRRDEIGRSKKSIVQEKLL